MRTCLVGDSYCEKEAGEAVISRASQAEGMSIEKDSFPSNEAIQEGWKLI